MNFKIQRKRVNSKIDFESIDKQRNIDNIRRKSEHAYQDLK